MLKFKLVHRWERPNWVTSIDIAGWLDQLTAQISLRSWVQVQQSIRQQVISWRFEVQWPTQPLGSVSSGENSGIGWGFDYVQHKSWLLNLTCKILATWDLLGLWVGLEQACKSDQMSVAVKLGKISRAGSQINLWVFVFWKIVSQMFPALSTIVTNSEWLPL